MLKYRGPVLSHNPIPELSRRPFNTIAPSDPKMTFTSARSKVHSVWSTVTTQVLNFTRFTLWLAVFKLQAILRQVHLQ